MTSWVLTIDKNYPNHWDIAKHNGFWDTTKDHPIEPGDHVYFWLAGSGFVGRVVVTEGSEPLDATQELPWTDEGVRTYVARFRFSEVAEPTASVRWGEVADNTDLSRRLNPVLRTGSSAAEAWLASLFQPLDEVAATFPTEEAAERAVVDTTRDTRQRTLAEIAVRRGQPAFRKALLAAYESRCAVTGTSTEQVLEAAHIFPYRGEHTNVTKNGLLLRSDIHTLFDLFLLTVVKEGQNYVVRVSPEIAEQSYQSLDGEPLVRLPERVDRPSSELLRLHNEECPWLGTTSTQAVDVKYSSEQTGADDAPAAELHASRIAK